MPFADIRGVAINYEVVGASGPSVALTPGGRNPLGDVRPIAASLAAAGYRVLIHDRRNCGASDISFDASQSEADLGADDLYALLQKLDMLPAIIGGCSSGARLSLAFARRQPKDVRALLLWRLTGGAFAVRRLTDLYYDAYIRVAQQGGMAAICQTEHFAEVIRNRPDSRCKLMATEPNDLIGCMRAWRDAFVAGGQFPLIGSSGAELRALAVPVCVVPGDDRTHPGDAAANAAQLIPQHEVHRVAGPDQDLDASPREEWEARNEAIASVFADFLRRRIQ